MNPEIDELAEGAYVMDPREIYDKCIVAVTYHGDKVVYDTDLVLKCLMEEEGMSDEEALDWFEYNMVGSYLGDGTPIFIKSF